MQKFTKLFSIFAVLSMLLFMASNSHAASGTYTIDPAHSTLGFAIKHMQVGTTRGGFDDYAGTVAYDPEDLSAFKADVTIQVKSIDTKVEQRDNHLRSPDFFDAEKFPTITFQSSRLEKRGEGTVIIGNLTMKGVTKEITFPVTISGPVKSPMGATVIGIQGETMINRQDFGISFSKTLDNGGLMVDDMVMLVVEVEADMKPADAAAK